MTGRRILITGASRGIGRATAVALAEPGVELWLNYRSNERAANETAELCRDRGATVELLGFDVADLPAVDQALARRALDEPIDVLINNAGITKDALLPMTSPDDWTLVSDVNLKGLYAVTRHVVRGMLRSRRGRIINITSITGQRGNPGQVLYGTTKAGIIGFTKSLALEIAKRGITVNAVSPGLIETDMTSSLPRETVEPTIPMGRFGRPSEVAAAVRFLASDEASYITGHVLSVNGGLYT